MAREGVASIPPTATEMRERAHARLLDHIKALEPAYIELFGARIGYETWLRDLAAAIFKDTELAFPHRPLVRDHEGVIRGA